MVSIFRYNIGSKNVLNNSSIKKKGIYGWFMIDVLSAPKNKIIMGPIEIRVNNSDVCRVPNDKKIKILLTIFRSNGNLSSMIIGS